jgi:hypothetical protein
MALRQWSVLGGQGAVPAPDSRTRPPPPVTGVIR